MTDAELLSEILKQREEGFSPSDLDCDIQDKFEFYPEKILKGDALIKRLNAFVNAGYLRKCGDLLYYIINRKAMSDFYKFGVVSVDRDGNYYRIDDEPVS